MGDVSLCTELGRFMLAPNGHLVTRVLHEKQTYKDYIGVDACAANLMRPAMYGAYHHITVMGKEDQPCDHQYDVTGALCENNDKFAVDRMLPEIHIGDLLVIQSIDRLGRNYGEILEQWRVITKEKRVDIVVLDIPLLDTRAQGQDLTGTFIADLVLQILSYVAQTEREMIRKRQAEGIAAAKARGVRFGRRPLPLPESYEDVRQKWESGQLSARAAAIALGVSHSTFLKWTRYK